MLAFWFIRLASTSSRVRFSSRRWNFWVSWRHGLRCSKLRLQSGATTRIPITITIRGTVGPTVSRYGGRPHNTRYGGPVELDTGSSCSARHIGSCSGHTQHGDHCRFLGAPFGVTMGKHWLGLTQYLPTSLVCIYHIVGRHYHSIVKRH